MAAAAVRAGTMGSVAMIPVGLAIRRGLGGAVNVYGELVVERLLGRVVPWALAVEHVLISWVLALPVVWMVRRWPDVRAVPAGVVYGAAIWGVINSFSLPLLFGRPTPWEVGWSAIWPSLTVHVVYSVATTAVAKAGTGR